MADLFANSTQSGQPLAARMRPRSLDEYIGQEHLLGEGRPLKRVLESAKQGGHLHSMIFWGPPGVGKTTLALLLTNYVSARFITLSAVMSGVKDIRAAVEQARQHQAQGLATVLFVDEVHRFNKSQQDAFLPFVEEGLFTFIGATTENPSFELNNALLSRARVYRLQSLDLEQVKAVLNQAIQDPERGLGSEPFHLSDAQLQQLALAADGDARRALNLLEVVNDLVTSQDGDRQISDDLIAEALTGLPRRFDKQGDYFYDQISALHKSVRGSSVDGALYWFVRMLDGGCDALYIARRVVRMASEDIGNADPRALTLALNAWETQERLGSPEGELAIAQAIAYLAAAPKSNAVYTAFNQWKQIVADSPSYEVPVHLRNAPTKLMKSMGHGQEYRYAHDEPDAYAAGEVYLPFELKDVNIYHPVNRGLETKISQKLDHLRSLDKQSPSKRYEDET